MAKVGDPIPGTNLKYEESDIQNLSGVPAEQQAVQPAQQAPQPSQPIQPAQPQAEPPVTHTVKAGDTLTDIAQKFGVSTAQITGYRSGNPNLIFPGEVLNINKLPVQPQEPQKGTEPQPQAQQALTAAPVAPQGVPQPAPATPAPQAGIPPESLTSPISQPTGNDFDNLFKQYGLSVKNDITDVVKTISKLYGFDEVNGQVKDLDDEFIDKSSEIRDNPWLTSDLQDKKVKTLKDTYDRKRDALINRLQLQQNIVGQAITLYNAERNFQQQNLFKAIELRKKEIENQQSAEKEAERIRQFETREDRAERGEVLAQERLNLSEEAGVRAEAAGRRAEAASARAEERAGQDFSPQQKFRNFTVVKSSFQNDQRVKDFREINTRFDILEQAQKEARTTKNFVAVDQAIISTFNKITDPQSVVRESEYARTVDDLALLNRLKGKVGKLVLGGPGLTQSDRDAIVRLAGQFQQVAQQKFEQAKQEAFVSGTLGGLDDVELKNMLGTDILRPPPLSDEQIRQDYEQDKNLPDEEVRNKYGLPVGEDGFFSDFARVFGL